MKMENSNAFQCKETVLCQQRSFIKRETGGTSSDNEWKRVTTSGTTIENEWQRVAISANSSFFRIREESTTKHPKENPSNLKEDLEEKRDIELRADQSP